MAEHYGPIEVKRDINLEPGEWRMSSVLSVTDPPDPTIVKITVRKDVLANMVEAGYITEGDGVIIVHRVCCFPRGLYGVTKIDGEHVHAEMLDYERPPGP